MIDNTIHTERPYATPKFVKKANEKMLEPVDFIHCIEWSYKVGHKTPDLH